MKKIVLTLLMTLMLMPSLACAMPECKGETSKVQPCHSASYENQNEDSTDMTAGMLLKDCMGLDFFMSNTTNDIQPDLSVDTLDFAWADITATYNLEPRSINAIRGPPPSADVTSPSRPLYLTTQRFRI